MFHLQSLPYSHRLVDHEMDASSLLCPSLSSSCQIMFIYTLHIIRGDLLLIQDCQKPCYGLCMIQEKVQIASLSPWILCCLPTMCKQFQVCFCSHQADPESLSKSYPGLQNLLFLQRTRSAWEFISLRGQPLMTDGLEEIHNPSEFQFRRTPGLQLTICSAPLQDRATVIRMEFCSLSKLFGSFCFLGPTFLLP